MKSRKKKCTDVEYVGYIYEITEEMTAYYLGNFAHKWSVGENVTYRQLHKKTTSGVITRRAYSTEKHGGGTIKIYMINGIWIGERRIKGMIKD